MGNTDEILMEKILRLRQKFEKELKNAFTLPRQQKKLSCPSLKEIKEFLQPNSKISEDIFVHLQTCPDCIGKIIADRTNESVHTNEPNPTNVEAITEKALIEEEYASLEVVNVAAAGPQARAKMFRSRSIPCKKQYRKRKVDLTIKIEGIHITIIFPAQNFSRSNKIFLYYRKRTDSNYKKFEFYLKKERDQWQSQGDSQELCDLFNDYKDVLLGLEEPN